MGARVTWISAAVGATAIAATAVAAVALAGRPAQAGARGRGARSRAAIALRPEVGSSGRGSWCWFGDPRAVRVMGRYDQTFVGWIDWSGDIRVGAYDARFGFVAARTIGHLFHDDHGAPALFVEPGNRLTVFWSGHDGKTMFYRSTLRPEDITGWGPVQRVESKVKGQRGFTYPNPVLLPAEDNRLFLFWRGADWSADYAVRTLDGRWAKARELIRNPGERPYLKVAGNGADAIGLAFTDGHPRSVLTSIYYAAYRAGVLWTAAGRLIARASRLPIAPRRAQVVYDARKSHVPSWVWDVAFGSDGRPVIVYATFPGRDHDAYWYAHWTGARWVSHFLTVGGPSISPDTIERDYSGGLVLDHSDPSVVYLSRKRNGWFEIERWVTGDGGESWNHTAVVRTPGADDLRPVVPRGADGGPVRLLWLQGRYGTYQRYRTSVNYLR